MPDTFPLQHTPEWTVVRLPDGVLGVASNNRSRGRVLVSTSGHVGRLCSMHEPATPIRYPAQLAGAYRDALNALAQHGTDAARIRATLAALLEDAEDPDYAPSDQRASTAADLRGTIAVLELLFPTEALP